MGIVNKWLPQKMGQGNILKSNPSLSVLFEDEASVNMQELLP